MRRVMDRAQLGMMIEANMLADGAEIVSGMPWLEKVAADVEYAFVACPHMGDGSVRVPVFYYPAGLDGFPDGPAATCPDCSRAPKPVCYLCGAAAEDGVMALSGLLMIVVALCPEHAATETEL